MSIASPYRTLPAPRRQTLVAHDITSSREARDTYIRAIVARGGGFRPEKLRKWPAEQLAREVVRHSLESPHDELRLLVALYVDVEPALQIEFLDATGVRRDGASIPEDLEPPFADADRIRTAADALIERHGDEARRYLRTISIYNDAAWPGLADMMQAPA
ncbi:MAG TPA: hypothetical protein VGL65_13205 [Gemmatimonadales bacterium]|jgi:hypothetical protein